MTEPNAIPTLSLSYRGSHLVTFRHDSGGVLVGWHRYFSRLFYSFLSILSKKETLDLDKWQKEAKHSKL